MDIMFDCRVFCRQTKSIPAHGVKNIISLHPAESGDNIPDGIIPDMPHVNIAGRIGKHLQNIILGP